MLSTGVSTSTTSGYQPAARLPQPSGSGRRAGEIARALLAAVALLALLVGVPLGLARLVGNPLPTSLPTRDWLTAELSQTMLINVLAAVAWVVWAQFAVCVIAEWRAARRNRLPGRMPLGGGTQLVARRLVAAVLLLSGAATLAPVQQAVTAARPVAITASAVPGAAAGSPTGADLLDGATRPGGSGSASLAGSGADSDHGDRAASRSERIVHYEVQPPRGRNHDCLWDIAERTLGDPRRYKEIFELNKDRVQADGRRLVDADLIHPGWVLVMPPDAKGAGITVVEPVLARGQAPKAQPDQPAASSESGAAEAVGAEAAGSGAGAEVAGGNDGTAIAVPATPVRAGSEADAKAPVAQAEGSPAVSAGADHVGLSVERGALGGGLLLAGVLLALSARRGPYGEPDERDERLRLAAEPGLSALLDRALRQLSAARAEQGLPLPEVLLALLAEDELVLHLSTPAGQPPAPWHGEPNGRSWLIRAEDLAALDLGDAAGEQRTPAPYPTLANIARTDDYEVLVDLEAAPGLIAIGGDPAAAREVAASLAAELALNSWSDGIRVTLIGFGDELSAVAPAAIRQVDRLDDVLAEVEAEADQHRALLTSLGVADVLSGRALPGTATWPPRVLVLSGPPTPEESARLAALAGGGRTPIAALCVGDSPSARWRFAVAADGRIELGALGLQGTARRLPPESYREVLQLLRNADRSRPKLARAVTAIAPHAAALVCGAAEPGRAQAIDPTLGWDDEAEVTVQLLGPVRVGSTVAEPGERADLLTEVVVAAALHPEGLHEATLRSAVWPRGVDDDTVARVVEEVQHWLGADSAGQPRFHRAADGRWRLSGDVRSDWDGFRALAAAATGPQEYLALRRALELGSGEVFADTPAGRYAWLAFHRSARDARVLATSVARRAAALAVATGRPVEARECLRQGLRMVPTAEALWRDLLKLDGGGDPQGAANTAGELYRTLLRHGVRLPEPETDALVDVLAPGARPRSA